MEAFERVRDGLHSGDGALARGYPVGRANDAHIAAAVGECERLVVAWGVHAARLERPRKVLASLGRWAPSRGASH